MNKLKILKKLSKLARINSKDERVNLFNTSTLIMIECWHRKYHLMRISKKPKYTDIQILEKIKKDFIKIWVEFLRELLYFTESIENIKKSYSSIHKSKGEFLIRNVGLDRIIAKTAKNWVNKLEPDKYIHDEIAYALGVSVHNIDDYLHGAEDFWTKPYLETIIRGLFMREIINRSATEDSFDYSIYKFPSKDKSYFDSLIQLFNPKEFQPCFYITKLVNVGMNGADIIDKVVRRFNEEYEADEYSLIIFVPFFLDEDAQQALMHWRTEQNIDLHVLYLNHFYEIFRIENPRRIKDYIKQYILG